MIYAYDRAMQMPTVDLYDTQMMAMAINAAKDMYDRGLQLIKDFYKEYGDFMSPFAKDMEAYGNMVGGVRNLINTAYANGIDLLRSPEGRALISKAVYSVDPGKFNLMRSNAKTGYAYLDAIQKLRSLGKYSEAQELYDIMQNGGTKFSDFSTFDENGAHVWDRTSPIEATSLLDLTYDSYKNRTPRDLTAADFIESNGLTPSMFDKRYQYTGYLNSDLMKVAPGAAMSIAADPRAAYFRNLAEQKVAARGGNYTQADVDAQFYRDIADANRWALVDPTKKADEFALDDYRTANDIYAHDKKAAIDHRYKVLENGGDINEESGYSLLKDLYVTTLAKGAGIEYPPKGGFDVNELPQLLKLAELKQKAAIRSGADVLTSTGQFVSMDKINGVIPSSGANGRGHFLSPEAILNLRTEDAVRTSFKGWVQKGNPNNSGAVKTYRNNESKKIANALAKVNGKNGFYVKVVPTTDKNGNNMYPMVGDDNRWHTYARVRVYLSDGKDTKPTTLVEGKRDKGLVKMPKEGIELLLPIGLQSNESKASPDLSLSEREKVGIRPFSTVKKWIGSDGNADFPWGTNLIKKETSLQNEK